MSKTYDRDAFHRLVLVHRLCDSRPGLSLRCRRRSQRRFAGRSREEARLCVSTFEDRPADAERHLDHALRQHIGIAGFVFLGSAGKPLSERPRPEPGQVVRRWNP